MELTNEQIEWLKKEGWTRQTGVCLDHETIEFDWPQSYWVGDGLSTITRKCEFWTDSDERAAEVSHGR